MRDSLILLNQKGLKKTSKIASMSKLLNLCPKDSINCLTRSLVEGIPNCDSNIFYFIYFVSTYHSIVLEFWEVAVLQQLLWLFLRWRRRGQRYCFILTIILCIRLTVRDSLQIFDVFFLKIGNKGSSSFWFGYVKVFLELVILRLKKHCNLVILLFFQISLFLRTIRSRMTSLTANRTFDSRCIFGLERTCPCSMALLLAVLTVIIVNAHNLLIIAFH